MSTMGLSHVIKQLRNWGAPWGSYGTIGSIGLDIVQQKIESQIVGMEKLE